MEFSAASNRSLILEKLKPKQNLLAVSKLQSIEKIKLLYSDGQRQFAENYIQEALQKIESLSYLDIEWHLIGPIQKNKIKFLQKNFSFIHSIDSFELAEKISEKAVAIDYLQKVFIQVNLSNEPTKSGLLHPEVVEKWTSFLSLKGIKIVGLMTMPPLENEPEKNRPYFKELKKLANHLNLTELSMGTSHDYLIALEEGATWIRIGTVLFGEREMK